MAPVSHQTRIMSTKWTLSALIVISMLVTALVLPASLAAQSKCSDHLSSDYIPLVSMIDTYRGENKGEYFDPVTKKYWEVEYFDEDQLKKHELFVIDGQLIDHLGQPFDSVYDADSGTFEDYTFIVNKDRRIFILPEAERGRWHHSSLSQGQALIFAGTLSADRGQVREITDRSGHYKMTGTQTINGLRVLIDMGVNLDRSKFSGHFVEERFDRFSIKPDQVSELIENY